MVEGVECNENKNWSNNRKINICGNMKSCQVCKEYKEKWDKWLSLKKK